jgi:ABC-type transporter Mla MlaB component
MEWGDTEIKLDAAQEAELRERYESEKAKSLTHSEKSRDLQALRGKLDKNLNTARDEAQSSHLMTAPLLRQPKAGGDSLADKSFLVTGADVNTQANPEYMQTDPGFEVKPLDENSVERIVGDAAFLYAEGDDVTAESLMLRGVEEFPQHSKELYLCLLDLYHATGQRGQFDATAELFALTFKERTPTWDEETAGTASVSRRDSFTVETNLNESQAVDLYGYIEARILQNRDITIDFSKLRDVTESAMPVLATAIGQLNDLLSDIYVLGIERLRRVLTDEQAEMGKTQPYWLARLAVERLRNDMNSFVQVARDASHSAGVEGNTWAIPRCTVRAPLDLGSGLTLMALDETVAKDPRGGRANSRSSAREESYLNAIGLSGTMKGEEVDRAIHMRATGVTSLTQVIIDCFHLKRIDFEGGVTVLNWVSHWEGQGKQIKIVRANRMVIGLLRRLGLSAATTVMVHALY